MINNVIVEVVKFQFSPTKLIHLLLIPTITLNLNPKPNPCINAHPNPNPTMAVKYYEIKDPEAKSREVKCPVSYQNTESNGVPYILI